MQEDFLARSWSLWTPHSLMVMTRLEEVTAAGQEKVLHIAHVNYLVFEIVGGFCYLWKELVTVLS